MGTKTYKASCHCGSVRFRLASEEITTGKRCNCSICIRKGVVTSSNYFRASDVEVDQTTEINRMLEMLFALGSNPPPAPRRP